MIGAAGTHGRRGVRAGPLTSRALTTIDAERSFPVLAIVAMAWVVLVALDATGSAAWLHHHALIENGPALWIAIPLFLVAWLVMTAAMMVPASLPAIHAAGLTGARAGSIGADLAFIAAFLAVWAVFGLGAFLGDMVVHRLVDSTPWLAARPWLIEAGVLAFAGLYQFLPRKLRDLERCRHPGEHPSSATLHGAARFGIRHGLACVGASGALMLLMFGEGFGGLGWMIALTAVMVLEMSLASPRRLTAIVGIALVLLSVSTLAGPTAF